MILTSICTLLFSILGVLTPVVLSSSEAMSFSLVKNEYHFIGGPEAGLFHVLVNGDEPIEFLHHLQFQFFDAVKDDLCSLSKRIKIVLLKVRYHSVQYLTMRFLEPFGITVKACGCFFVLPFVDCFSIGAILFLRQFAPIFSSKISSVYRASQRVYCRFRKSLL